METLKGWVTTKKTAEEISRCREHAMEINGAAEKIQNKRLKRKRQKERRKLRKQRLQQQQQQQQQEEENTTEKTLHQLWKGRWRWGTNHPSCDTNGNSDRSEDDGETDRTNRLSSSRGRDGKNLASGSIGETKAGREKEQRVCGKRPRVNNNDSGIFSDAEDVSLAEPTKAASIRDREGQQQLKPAFGKRPRDNNDSGIFSDAEDEDDVLLVIPETTAIGRNGITGPNNDANQNTRTKAPRQHSRESETSPLLVDDDESSNIIMANTNNNSGATNDMFHSPDQGSSTQHLYVDTTTNTSYLDDLSIPRPTESESLLVPQTDKPQKLLFLNDLFDKPAPSSLVPHKDKKPTTPPQQHPFGNQPSSLLVPHKGKPAQPPPLQQHPYGNQATCSLALQQYKPQPPPPPPPQQYPIRNQASSLSVPHQAKPQPPQNHPPNLRWIAVLDTCAILESHQAVCELIQLAQKSAAGVAPNSGQPIAGTGQRAPSSSVDQLTIVVPYTVWDELDYRSKRVRDKKEQFKARRAARMLGDQLRIDEVRQQRQDRYRMLAGDFTEIGAAPLSIRSQSRIESHCAVEQFLWSGATAGEHIVNDDKILACALYEQEQFKAAADAATTSIPAAAIGGVVLVTMDNVLSGKARADGVSVHSMVDFVKLYKEYNEYDWW